MAASQFNLTATINAQANNASIVKARQIIQQSLSGVKVNVDIKITKGALGSLAKLDTRLVSLNKTLQTTILVATAAGTALKNMASVSSGLSGRFINQAKAATDLAKANRGISDSAKEATHGMTEFGRLGGLALKRFAAFTIATSVVFGFIRAVAEGVKAAIDFEKQMLKISQVTSVSISGLKGLSNEITRLSTTFGTSSSELVKVSKTLSQAGLTAGETKTALEALARTELAPTFTSIERTTEGAIASMKQFGFGAKDLGKALGAINAVAGRFAVESDDIIAAIRRAGGVFAAAAPKMQKPLDTLNQFIATFASIRATTRESAESIATGLRTIGTRLQRARTVELLKGLGVAVVDTEGKFAGIFQVVNSLSKVLKELDPRDIRFAALAEQLGGFRQINKVIPLIQQLGLRMEAYQVATAGANSLTDQTSIAMQGVGRRISQVKEEFLGLMRTITSSTAFNTFINSALTLTKQLIRLADSLAHILPMLTTVATIGAFKGAGRMLPGMAGVFRTGKADGGRVGFSAGGRADIRPRGLVPGGRGTRDTVRATLKEGSYVIRRNAVDSIGRDNLARLGRNKGGDVPALLTAGEYVFSPRAAKNLGGSVLNTLNNFDKFADGGPVYSDGRQRLFWGGRPRQVGTPSSVQSYMQFIHKDRKQTVSSQYGMNPMQSEQAARAAVSKAKEELVRVTQRDIMATNRGISSGEALTKAKKRVGTALNKNANVVMRGNQVHLASTGRQASLAGGWPVQGGRLGRLARSGGGKMMEPGMRSMALMMAAQPIGAAIGAAGGQSPNAQAAGAGATGGIMGGVMASMMTGNPWIIAAAAGMSAVSSFQQKKMTASSAEARRLIESGADPSLSGKRSQEAVSAQRNRGFLGGMWNMAAVPFLDKETRLAGVDALNELTMEEQFEMAMTGLTTGGAAKRGKLGGRAGIRAKERGDQTFREMNLEPFQRGVKTAEGRLRGGETLEDIFKGKEGGKLALQIASGSREAGFIRERIKEGVSGEALQDQARSLMPGLLEGLVETDQAAEDLAAALAASKLKMRALGEETLIMGAKLNVIGNAWQRNAGVLSASLSAAGGNFTATGTARRENVFRNTRAFSSGQISRETLRMENMLGGGDAVKRQGANIRAGKALQEGLPGILAAANEGKMFSKGEASAYVNEQVTRLLQNVGASPELIQSITSEVTGKLGPGKEEGTGGFGMQIPELISSLGLDKIIGEHVSASLELFGDAQDKFQANLEEVSGAIDNFVTAQNAINMQLISDQSRAIRNRNKLKTMSGQSLTLAERLAPGENTLNSLLAAGGVGQEQWKRAGQQQGVGGQVDILAGSIRRDRARLQEGGLNPQQQSDLKLKISANTEALKMLHGSTEELAAIEGAIRDEQRRKQGARSFTERLATAGPREMMDIAAESYAAMAGLGGASLSGPQAAMAARGIAFGGQALGWSEEQIASQTHGMFGRSQNLRGAGPRVRGVARFAGQEGVGQDLEARWNRAIDAQIRAGEALAGLKGDEATKFFEKAIELFDNMLRNMNQIMNPLPDPGGFGGRGGGGGGNQLGMGGRPDRIEIGGNVEHHVVVSGGEQLAFTLVDRLQGEFEDIADGRIEEQMNA